MRDVVDQLIEERAPWLGRKGPGVSIARRLLHVLLQYERTVKIGEVLETLPAAADVMQSAADMFAHAGNRRRSRPAGRLLADGDRLLRFSQDAWPHYGSRVRALAVDLDATRYAEREVAESPILEASGEGWNAQGMHHVDYLRRGADDWLAIVDGYTLGSRQKGQP
jgi:hypothetical protein